MTSEPVQVVVANCLALVNYADTTRVVNPVAKKDIVLNQVAVAVPERQRAAGLIEQVAAKDVAPGLTRDNLDLPVTAIEVVIFNQR